MILIDDGTIRNGKELPQPDQEGLCTGLENVLLRQLRCQVNQIPTLTAVVIFSGVQVTQWVRKGHGGCSGLPDSSSCFVFLPREFLWCVYAGQAICGF